MMKSGTPIFLLLASLLAPFGATADNYSVSIVGLELRSSDRVTSLDLEISGGCTVRSINSIPTDWAVAVTIESGLVTRVSMGAVHGMGFLGSTDEFQNFVNFGGCNGQVPLKLNGRVGLYQTGTEKEANSTLNALQIKIVRIGG